MHIPKWFKIERIECRFFLKRRAECAIAPPPRPSLTSIPRFGPRGTASDAHRPTARLLSPPAKQPRLGGDTETLEEGVRYTARDMSRKPPHRPREGVVMGWWADVCGGLGGSASHRSCSATFCDVVIPVAADQKLEKMVHCIWIEDLARDRLCIWMRLCRFDPERVCRDLVSLKVCARPRRQSVARARQMSVTFTRVARGRRAREDDVARAPVRFM